MPLFIYALLSFSLLFGYSSYSAANSPIVISELHSSANLVPYLTYICEQDGQIPFTPSTITQQKFQATTHHNISFSYRKTACWFKFQIMNPTKTTQSLVLDIPFSLLDDIQLFTLNNQQTLTEQYHAGDNVAYNSRAIAINNPAFLIQVPATTQIDYFLRIQTTSPFSLPIYLYALNDFILHQSNYELAIGVFYGITIGLLFYNFALWSLTRERNQILYVCYLTSSLVYFLWLHGLLFHLWPRATDWNNHGFYASILLMVVTGLLFIREYLQLSARPMLNNAFLLFTMITSILLFSLFFLPLWICARLAPTLTIFLIIIATYTGIRRWQDHLAVAPLFVIAWMSLLLAAAYTILMNYLGLGNINYAIYALQTGFALQQILLSMGLAQQMNALKEAKMRYEHESLLAKAESAAKSEFLARMSHEIRTPMNAVLGVTQLLQSSALNSEQQQQVSLLYNSGKQLLALINDILDFSRMDANKLTLTDEIFDLPELLSECISLFTIVAQQKSLDLCLQSSRDLPQWLMGDSLRIRQVLFNLLGNAIKFTAQGNVCLSVETIKLSDHDCLLRFSIQDSGIGISHQQQERLFTAFSQADNSITRHYGGSGLGLAISKQLVELMGGHITIDSQLGQGATFSFALAFKLASPKKINASLFEPSIIANYSTQPLTGLRVLVAEDSHINQIVIRTMLQRLGIHFTIVNNGEEALQQLKQQHDHFNIVLMDYEMPILDGVSTVKQLRLWEQQHHLTPLPVIALTAHALPHYAQLCRDAGMDDFLTKPIFLEQLSSKLQQYSRL